MKSHQAGFKRALLAVFILFLMLGGCRDRDSVKMTRGDGTTQDVSAAEAAVCIFSLGLACPGRGTNPYTDPGLSEIPNSPQRISAVAAGDGIPEIDLSWLAVTDERISGYRIYRDGSPVAETDEAAYTDSLLDADRFYCYTVVAIDDSLNPSAHSAEACARTSWTITTVKSGLREARPSIAVDALDQVHLAYVGFDVGGSREIAYANSLSGSWYSETVGEETGVFTEAPAIVVDPSASVHIGTRDSYTTNAFGNWRAESLEAYNFSAMALDSRGFVHLVSAGPDGGMNHTTNAGGGWASEAIGSGWWQQAALAIDDRDVLHVVYYDDAARNLVYSNNAGGSWVREVVANDFPPLWRLDLAVDAQRRPHVSYQVKQPVDGALLPAPGAGLGLGYASNASGYWRHAIVDAGDSVGAGSSMALDLQGYVHVSYTSQRDDELRYATNSTGRWEVRILDRDNAVDTECELAEELCGVTDIAVDGQGKVHVTYHDYDRVLYISNR